MTRPPVLKGHTHARETPAGRVYVTLNLSDGEPHELFITLGKSGSEERAFTEALARLCSVALQHGVPLGALTRQLRGISSEVTLGLGPNKILSVPDAVGQVLESFEEERDG